MTEKFPLASAPSHHDEPPDYNEAVSGDETRIPMVGTSAVEITARTAADTTSEGSASGPQGCTRKRWLVILIYCGMLLVPICGLSLVLWRPFQLRRALSGYGILFISYCVYLPMVLNWSKTYKMLLKAVSKEEFLDYVQRAAQSRPRITWRMKCYHDDDRTVTVTRGTRSPFSERHQERVTTWTGEQDFDFRRWENVSSDSVKPFDSEGFFTVTMSIDYVLGDKNTRTAFAQQKEGFVAMNRSQDRKYELDEVVDVEGVAKEIVVNTKSNGFFSLNAYRVAAVLLLGPLWCCIIARLHQRVVHHFAKKVFI